MMRRLAALLALNLLVSAAYADEAPKLETTLEKFSFAMGYRIARDMSRQGVDDVDAAAFTAGVRRALAGESFPFTREQIAEIMQAYRDMAEAKRASEATANAQAGADFLAENVKADGVKTLDGGVQYRVERAGSGDNPSESDKVKVHYSGALLDGTEFDSSYKRGEPTVLGLDAVIPGWRTALTAMAPGAKWRVWIPSDQAYGESGAGGKIGPNQTLVFDIELIEVVDAQ